MGCLWISFGFTFLCSLSQMLFESFLHFSVQCSRIFPAEYSCDCFVFVYFPEYYSGFIIFLCLLSTTSTKQQGCAFPPYLQIMKLWSAPAFSMFIIPNVIRVFLTFFGSVLEDFPRRVFLQLLRVCLFPRIYSGFIIFLCLLSMTSTKQQGLAPFLQTGKSWNFEAPPLFLCSLSRMLFGSFLHFSVQCSAISPPSILAIASCLFIIPNVIRVFLTFFG